MHHALNPDPYRGVFGDDAKLYANDIRDLITAATPGRVAGFFHETIQGVGGAVPLADGYLPLVYEVGTRISSLQENQRDPSERLVAPCRWLVATLPLVSEVSEVLFLLRIVRIV